MNPSIRTGCVISGRPEASAIVCTPEPGIAKAMSSLPGFAFAERIAWRSEPAPESLVLVTVKVAADSTAARSTPRTTRVLLIRRVLQGRVDYCRPKVFTRNVAICPRLALVRGQ